MVSQDYIIHKKLTALKQSKFRSKFKLAQKDRDYIAAKGLETIKEHAYQFINTRVARANPKNDGKQTPMRGIGIHFENYRYCINTSFKLIDASRIFN
jgi:hypothetical protein